MRSAVTMGLGVAMALALAPAAFADGPVPPPPPPAPAPTPAPPAQPGQLRIDVLGGIASDGHDYVLTGDNVTIVGHVKPYVAGQTVRVRITTPHRKPTLVHAAIRAGNGEGTFQVRFRTRRAVTYAIYVRHDATPQQALFAAKGTAAAVWPGSRMAVVLLTQGMRALGYRAGNGPAVTSKLGRELLAFRKVNGMSRIYTASRTIYDMVFAGRGGFKLRYAT